MSSNLIHKFEDSLHFFNLAQSFSKEKNYSKSLIFFRIAIKYNPDYPLLYYAVSNAYHLIEKDVEALYWNDKTLQLLEKLPNDTMNEMNKLNTWALRLNILEKNHEKIEEALMEFENQLNKSDIVDLAFKESFSIQIRIKKEELSKNIKTYVNSLINKEKIEKY